MSEIARLVTTEELEKFPDDDYRYELVDGRVIRMSPVGFQHGRIVARLCALLVQHVQGRKLGVVATELGFELARHPDTVRAPDVAFIAQDRIPSQEPRGFWKGPPDLAIEVLSPDDRPSEVRRPEGHLVAYRERHPGHLRPWGREDDRARRFPFQGSRQPSPDHPRRQTGGDEQQGGRAGADAADQRDDLSRRDGERDVRQRGPLRRGIPEAHAAQQ